MKRRDLRRLLFVVLAAAAGWLSNELRHPPVDQTRPARSDSQGGIEAAIRARRAAWVEASGRVAKLLPDDLHGSRHQRFLVVLAAGERVLIAHNIDLAPRVPVRAGDTVRFRGQYEWNERGGVVHWTHHDPQQRRRGGWLELAGQRYQ